MRDSAVSSAEADAGVGAGAGANEGGGPEAVKMGLSILVGDAAANAGFAGEGGASREGLARVIGVAGVYGPPVHGVFPMAVCPSRAPFVDFHESACMTLPATAATGNDPKPDSAPDSAPDIARGTDSEAVPRKRTKLRKEEIIREATQLFAERGYEGASMGDLAERVGLRKASLFHHFPSKDALYETVLSQLIVRLRSDIEAALRAEGSFEQRMDQLSDTITTTLGSEPFAARVLLREMLDFGPVIREGLGNSLYELLAVSKAFADVGQKEGHVDPETDTTQLVLTLVGLHLGPFALCTVAEGFTGESAFSTAFVQKRKLAVRAQVRKLAGKAR